MSTALPSSGGGVFNDNITDAAGGAAVQVFGVGGVEL